MIGIYKITSPTGRIYIGQSIDISRRFYSYKRCDCKNSVKLYRSLLKHGANKHTFEVVELCDTNKLNERERYFQELFNANSDENLNCLLTKTETKKQVGLKISNAQKIQIGNTHRGKVNSIETRNKIKAARANQVITDAHKKAISDNSGVARIVLNLETGMYFKSAKEASYAHGIKHNTLVGALIGRSSKIKNFIYA